MVSIVSKKLRFSDFYFHKKHQTIHRLLQYKDIEKLKVKRWIKMYHGKAVQKKKKNWSNHINLILQNEKNDQRDKKKLQNDKGFDSPCRHSNP